MSRKFDVFEDDDEEEEGANWQDSYSDLVTDLLAVFVILLSFAMMSNAAMANAHNSSKIDVFPESGSSTGILFPGETIIENKENFNQLYESIEEYIEQE